VSLAGSARIAPFAIALSLGACRSERAAPTYADPVAGILTRRCLPCHGSPDGNTAVVPPALGTYEEAARLADPIARSVMRREMPPAGADASGLCGEWQDAAWLEPQEITALEAWARAGAPRGTSVPATAKDATPRPASNDRSNLQVPAFAPRVGADSTRCFLIAANNTEDTFATALSLHSLPALALRQAQLYALDTPESAATASRFDAEDSLPGFACYGSSRVPDARLVASWSWSEPIQSFPEGSGVPLRARQPLVLRLRYNLLGLGFAAPPVHTNAELALSANARAARFIPLRATGFHLPAAQRQAEVHAELTLQTPLTVHGVVPTLHTLGRTLHLELDHDDQRTCLAHFGHWSVYTQQLYRYKKPLELAAGTRLQVTCVYSTTSRQEEVREGDGSDEEACGVGLWVTEP
jgi:hypothetical protein